MESAHDPERRHGDAAAGVVGVGDRKETGMEPLVLVGGVIALAVLVLATVESWGR